MEPILFQVIPRELRTLTVIGNHYTDTRKLKTSENVFPQDLQHQPDKNQQTAPGSNLQCSEKSAKYKVHGKPLLDSSKCNQLSNELPTTIDKEHDISCTYTQQVQTMLDCCTSEQQKEIVKNVVQTSKNSTLKVKFEVLDDAKEALKLDLKPANALKDAITKLIEQHTDVVDERLKQILNFNSNGDIKNVLEKLISKGPLLDLRESTHFKQIRSCLQSLKYHAPDFPLQYKDNAVHLNSNLKSCIVGRGHNIHPSIFEAISLKLAGDESLSTTIRILTYMQMQESTKVKFYYYQCKKYNIETLSIQIFDLDVYATPPVIELLAKTLQKNIIVHWGGHGVSDSAISFGESKNSKIHILTVDTQFYPVYCDEKGKKYITMNLHSPTQNPSSVQPTDLQVMETNFTRFVQLFTTPCMFCTEFGYKKCYHITTKDIGTLAKFRTMLLNPKYGSLIATDYAQILYASGVTLPKTMNGKVIPMNVSGDNNCMYNAISIALFGTEDLATALRRAVATDYTKNEAHYVQQFVNMNYDDNQLIDIKRRIFCDSGKQAWGIDESLLIASKVLTRRIIVHSHHNDYQCTQAYDLNHKQSSVYNPVLLISRDLGKQKHFYPLIPYNWNHMELPSIKLDQFKKFEHAYDTTIIIPAEDETKCETSKHIATLSSSSHQKRPVSQKPKLNDQDKTK